MSKVDFYSTDEVQASMTQEKFHETFSTQPGGDVDLEVAVGFIFRDMEMIAVFYDQQAYDDCHALFADKGICN